jgi:hypothetical protein|tara:strand:- start:825 stop:1073 length:249 start_codon:yes stop_codon:yes gene_type:complete
METKNYTSNEFLTYLGQYQDLMMEDNKQTFMLIYMSLQSKAEVNIVLRRKDFAILCTDLQLDSEELTFIDIDEKVTIQKSIL